ncbi:MAG: hypothetical protein JJU29_12695 [Verrucomicrobia bacterium]|nr:hypothetical protein [Verrucomicrobiota bacterium]MCH8512645.1 hypothetical protein [Kiritimatiellia bacterium]
MADSSTVYLCYDLKGIQSFIFAVPRLKYICGGSALIDRFDRDIALGISQEPKFGLVECLFTGGGKGAFKCPDTPTAEQLMDTLVKEAHQDGLSISFGLDVRYSEAALQTERSFPYLPPATKMGGHPCPESGLYPTEETEHEMIRRRVWQHDDHLARRYEKELLEPINVPGALLDEAERLVFFHEVSEDTENGRAGHAALGNRNRWAVITMDGNDMGRQHQAGKNMAKEQYESWLQAMSAGLDETTRSACKQGIAKVIKAWKTDLEKDRTSKNDLFQDFRDGKRNITLPIRPLVVGGDDIIVLCHVSYAMTFVKSVCEAFEHHSRMLAQNRKGGLWPATGDCLTISAGVLYSPISLPLATAISYAELLLASAKSRGREETDGIEPEKNGVPAPACVDWESVTEGVIDTPAARRQREYIFRDLDCNEKVLLTTRPMTLDEYAELEVLKNHYRKIPGTIRHEVLKNLQAAFWDRKVFLARLGKRTHSLVQDLEEGDQPRQPPRGKWVHRQPDPQRGEQYARRCTPVPDALLLLEEEHRMSFETILED